MNNFISLLNRALAVMNERRKEMNTATRIGSLFRDILDYFEKNKADIKQVDDIAASVDVLAVTKAEKSVVEALMNGIIKQPAVDTYNDITGGKTSLLSQYPNPQKGWDVLVREDNTRYNWNGTIWVDMETGIYDNNVVSKNELSKYKSFIVLSGQKTEIFTTRELNILSCIKNIRFEVLEEYKDHDFALYAFGSTQRNGTKSCTFWIKDLTSNEFGEYIFKIDIPYEEVVPKGTYSNSVVNDKYRMEASVDFAKIKTLFGDETWLVWTTEKGGNIRFLPTIVNEVENYASDINSIENSLAEINTIGFKPLGVALTGNGYVHYPTGEIRTTQTPYKYSEPQDIVAGVQYGIRCMAGGIVSVLSYYDDKGTFISGQKTTYPDNTIGEIKAIIPTGAKKIVYCGVEGTITALTSIPISEMPSFYQQKANILKGLTTGFEGDSLTEFGYHINALVRLSGCIPVKYGAGGTTIAKRNGHTSSFIERYANIDKATLDAFIVFGGTNDFGNGVPLGDLGSTDEFTFYGACYSLFSSISKDFVDKPIYIVTPLHRQDTEAPEYKLEGGLLTPNKIGSGAFLSDYVKAIKEVATIFSLPVIDAYSESRLAPLVEENATKYFGDKLHINAYGGELLGNLMYQEIEK